MKKLNSNISNVGGSASVSLMQKSAMLKASGAQVTDMAGGEPDFDTPYIIRKAAIESIEMGHTHYAVGKGIPQLREAIAHKLLVDNGIETCADNVIVTPGAKYSVYMAVAAVVNPGDEVIILAPHWVSYIPIVKLCGGIPVIVNLDYEENYRISKEKIMDKITDKTKLMIINYPNNPTGHILHKDEGDVLKEIVSDTDIFVLSDEIYEKIIFDGKKSISLGSIKEIADNVITVNGFSKCTAMTGWRIGYVSASTEVVGAMYKVFVHSITGVCTFIQEAAVEAFKCNEEIEKMALEYKRRRDYLVSELSGLDGIKIGEPEGTFYLWLCIDTDKSATEISAELLEKYQICVVPGSAYGEEKGVYIRCCFATDNETLKKFVEKFKKYLSNK